MDKKTLVGVAILIAVAFVFGAAVMFNESSRTTSQAESAISSQGGISKWVNDKSGVNDAVRQAGQSRADEQSHFGLVLVIGALIFVSIGAALYSKNRNKVRRDRDGHWNYNTSMKTILVPAVFALLVTAAACGAQTINFETLPGGAIPTEGMAISNQFAPQFGVTFSFIDGRYPHIAEVGAPATAFWGRNFGMGPDEPRANQNVGRFFLTDDGTPGGSPFVPASFLITYSNAVRAASGVILDVDLGERWRIEARNSQTQVVATVNLQPGTNNAEDGLAAPWSFVRTNADIHSILISFSGTGQTPGLAFDNFSPSLSLPPPSLSVTFTQRVARVGVSGAFGSTCRVEYATSLPSTNWQSLTNIVLTNAPQQFTLDPATSNAPRRFYRAIGL